MKKHLKNLLYSAYAHSKGNLAKYKNIHQGESCYLIGDGASVKWFDLKAFNDKPVFVLCYLFFHRQFHQIDRPLYTPFNSPSYFYSHYQMTIPPHIKWENNIQKRYREFIKQYTDTEFFVNLSNLPVLYGKNVNYLFQTIPNCEFSKDCLAQNILPFEGGFRAAIGLAIFMGFTKIFLVGCDYTHKQACAKHWYEFGEGVPQPHEGYNKEFFEIASKYAEITTITLEGEGSHLPAIEYEKYTNLAPIYKENHELIEKDDLSLLDTWPGYSIFPPSDNV